MGEIKYSILYARDFTIENLEKELANAEEAYPDLCGYTRYLLKHYFELRRHYHRTIKENFELGETLKIAEKVMSKNGTTVDYENLIEKVKQDVTAFRKAHGLIEKEYFGAYGGERTYG